MLTRSCWCQVARDYPLPAQECKRRIRDGFRRNSHLTDDEAILRAVHHGRYKVSLTTSPATSRCAADRQCAMAGERVAYHAVCVLYRVQCREAIAVIQVKKYRQLKRQYEPTEAADGASSEQQQHRAASSGTA